MGVYIGTDNSRLPNTYQEVEYITSSGTQYIDTWLSASNTLAFEFDIIPNTSYISEYAIIWNYWSANALFLSFYQSKYRFHNWGSYTDWPTVTSWKVSIRLDNTWFTVGSVFTALAAWSNYGWSWHIFLFDTANHNKRWIFSLCEVKVYNSWNLLMDLVPCYRISDSVVWMYDLVGESFYTNAWTWTFTKWDDVANNELRNAFIWDYHWRHPWTNTILYYPLHNSLTDVVWDYPRQSGAATYSDNMATITTELRRSGTRFNGNTWDFTISAWFKWVSGYKDVWFHWNSSYSGTLLLEADASWAWAGYYSSWWKSQYTTATEWTLYNVIAVKSSWTMTVYVNWTSIWSVSAPNYPWYWASWDTSYIRVGCICADVIVESVARTASEALEYYNLTKWNYWL